MWHELVERLGGVYDPITGKPDEKKLAVARDHTFRELARQNHADAVLASFITLGIAIPQVDSTVFPPQYRLWDEPLLWHGEPIDARMLLNMPQRLLAGYFNAILYDTAQVELYSARLGIEWIAIYMARGHEERPDDQVFQNEQRNEHVVATDLNPLLGIASQVNEPAPEKADPEPEK